MFKSLDAHAAWLRPGAGGLRGEAHDSPSIGHQAGQLLSRGILELRISISQKFKISERSRNALQRNPSEVRGCWMAAPPAFRGRELLPEATGQRFSGIQQSQEGTADLLRLSTL